MILKHPALTSFLFDMDGLLIDTEKMSYEAWLSVAHSYGINLEPVYPSVIGKGVKVCDEIFRAHFGQDLPISEMRKKKNELLRGWMEQKIPPKEGALELLAFLHSTLFPTALVTSSLREEAQYRLTKARVGHIFTCAVYGDEVERGKPAPDMYLLAAERLRAEPSTCVVFEDSHSGVQSALAAGMSVVMIPDLLPPEPWVVKKKDVMVRETLSQVLKELKALNS